MPVGTDWHLLYLTSMSAVIRWVAAVEEILVRNYGGLKHSANDDMIEYWNHASQSQCRKQIRFLYILA